MLFFCFFFLLSLSKLNITQKLKNNDTTINNDSDDEEDENLLNNHDLQEAHAESKAALVTINNENCKKRQFRTNSTTRTWREMINDGGLEPSYHTEKIETEKARQIKLRKDAGGKFSKKSFERSLSKKVFKQ